MSEKRKEDAEHWRRKPIIWEDRERNMQIKLKNLPSDTTFNKIHTYVMDIEWIKINVKIRP